jgi:hypothetical protein
MCNIKQQQHWEITGPRVEGYVLFAFWANRAGISAWDAMGCHSNVLTRMFHPGMR